MIRDYGMFWSSVVEAASLLSHLILSPFPFFFIHSLLPSEFCLSRLLNRFTLKHLSYLYFQSFPPICSAFCSPNSCFDFLFLIFPPPSNLFSLSVHQDKLSEEVQKQHDGPVEKGSLPVTRAELDPRLLLNPEHDASQAEEDKDKTKLLLERLKALEVLTRHHAFLLSL